MRKTLSTIVIAVMLAAFTFGCAGVSKETKVKCPKCGAVFTVDEGLKNIMP